MLDLDFAEMYGVETRVLKQAVRRNIDLFPADFMFELNQKEIISGITKCDTLKAALGRLGSFRVYRNGGCDAIKCT